MKIEKATYKTRPSINGKGTFFYTSCCGNRMFSVKDKWAYDGCYCPKCLWNGKYVVLRLAEEERDGL